jgi:DNA-binding NtrC family response regulator
LATFNVIALSEAFREFWKDLAADLGITINILGPGEVGAPGQDTVALIVAAGGAEGEAIHWLESHRTPLGTTVLVVGTDPGRRTAMQLVARGASDYFALPDDLEIFRNAVSTLLRNGKPRAVRSSSQADVFAGIIGESAILKRELHRAGRLLVHRNARALILGETGTGKELLARAIHGGGPRAAGPFVAVNCSSLPASLIESELFGHERGSFTDAHAAKPGLFELADGGTLFLDEIGDLPLALQAKLLRVLEDSQIRRVGGTKSRSVDVRVLAATNERLPESVREGKFREDLYFRLSAVTLTPPPLRERGNDCILIAEWLLKQLAGEHGLPIPTLTNELRRQIRAYPWPGNVRELKNAVERALLLSNPGELNADELLPPMGRSGPRDGLIPFPAPLHQIATAAARATVDLCGGNRSESARRLAISSRRLRRLLNGGPESASELDEDEAQRLTV